MPEEYLAEIATEDPDEETEFYLFEVSNGSDAVGLADRFTELNPGLISVKRLYSLNPIADLPKPRDGPSSQAYKMDEIRKARFRRFPLKL